MRQGHSPVLSWSNAFRRRAQDCPHLLPQGTGRRPFKRTNARLTTIMARETFVMRHRRRSDTHPRALSAPNIDGIPTLMACLPETPSGPSITETLPSLSACGVR